MALTNGSELEICIIKANTVQYRKQPYVKSGFFSFQPPGLFLLSSRSTFWRCNLKNCFQFNNELKKFVDKLAGMQQCV